MSAQQQEGAKPRRDRRSRYARQRWPQPLSSLEGKLVAVAMCGAGERLPQKPKGWRRWLAR